MTIPLTLSQNWFYRIALCFAALFFYHHAHAQAPSLGTYANVTIAAGGSTTVTPSAAPANVTRAVVNTHTDFDGVLSVNPLTGVVTITNALHAGTYTVLVKGFNALLSSATATFSLTVTNPSCSAGQYNTGSNISVNGSSQQCAVGDFNNDGNQDLVNTSNSTTLSIRLGNGTGGFTAMPDITAGSGTRYVAVADFNGDGNQDVVTTNVSSANFTVALGDGTGAFPTVTNIATAAFPTSVTTGDFNNDGITDLVLATSGGTISVFIGIGDGSFGAPATFSLASGAVWYIAVGDFNEDGNDDLAIPYSGASSVFIRLGTGTGTFTAGTTVSAGSNTEWITIADFNNDNHQDFAISNATTNVVSIRCGNGTGAFTSLPDLSVNNTPIGLAAADMNGDGNPDLLVERNAGLEVYTGNGAGSFTFLVGMAVGGTARRVTVGDFNNDNIHDVAVPNSASAIHIRLGQKAEIAVRGNTLDIADGDNTPSLSDFTNFGTSCSGAVVRTFTIHNTGGQTLNVTSIAITGTHAADFTITAAAAAAIAPAGSTTFQVTFTPGGAGARNATITITNSDCDEASYDFAITGMLTTPVSGTTVVTNVACFGGNTGAINLTPTGGTGPYTFNWLPSGPTTEDRTGLIAGTYSVQITDANGCNGTVTATVTQPTSPVSGTTVVTNVACFGGNTGGINITPTGGTSPYTFNWLPSGPTTEDRTGLVAGTYSVQITDVNGCNGTVTATVTQAGSLIVSPAAQTNVSSFGGNTGAASINTPSGGVAPYSYNWTPGNPTGDGTTSVTNLTAGTWTCTVTDANGCNATQTFVITQPGCALNFDGINDYASATTTTGIPIGNSNYTLEAWIKPTSFGYRGIVGWGNYGTNSQTNALRLDPSGELVNYWWFNDLSVNPMNTFGGSPSINLIDGNWHHVAATFDGTTRRIYVDGYLKGQDNPTGHNVPFANNLTIGRTLSNENFPGSIDEVRIWNRALCQAEILNNRTCEIATTASGLVANYHFNQGTAGGSNSTVNTLIDVSGNNNTASLIGLTLSGAASNWIGPGAVTSGVSCAAFVAPSVNVTVTSQTNVSCYGGSNGAAVVSAVGGTDLRYDWTPGTPAGDGTASVSGLTAGTWTVTVTNGCSGTGSLVVTIGQPSAPVSGTTVVTNVACFGGNTGAINLTPTGGTGPYTFNWLPSGPTTEDRTGLVAGTYSVQITDVNGCIGTVTASVTQPTSPVSGTTVVTNVACFGGNTGAINLTPTGGTGPYTFNWLPSGPTTEDRTGLIAGTYSVQITDVNGCVGTVTASVTQPTSPVSGTRVVTNVACFGGNTGAINLTPTGGTGPYTFNWLPSGPTTEDRTGLVAGTYSVQITDVNGCVGTVTASVTQPTSPVSGTTVVTNVACFGGNTGAINLTPNGGVGPYTFNWLPSGPTTEDRTGLIAGTYSVQITDANGCIGTVTATVTAPQQISFTAAAQTNVSCFGGSNGAFTVNPAAGGAGSFTYDWAPGNPTGDGTTSVSGLTAGTWTVTTTDANGCTAAINFTITEPTQISFTAAAQTNVSCFGGSNGAFTVNPASGGAGSFTYDWAPGNPTGDGTTSVSGLTAGTWTVTATDANGCTAVINFTITQPPAITVSASQTDVLCNGGNSGSATVTVSGGTAPFAYTWSSGGTAATESGLSAGNYSVFFTDANGCSRSQSFTITAPTAIVVSSSQTDALCNGSNNGSATVNTTGGTAPYTYAWSSGGTNATETGLTAGTYSVFITDANGCSTSETFSITEPAALTVTTSQTDVLCNGGNSGTASVTVSGGTAPFSYAWTSGGTNATEQGLTAGSYNVHITDANGCSTSASVTLVEPTAIVLTTTADSANCYSGNDGSATVVASGGTGYYSYAWSSGGTGATETGLGAGIYSVDVTDANGCSAQANVMIEQPGMYYVVTAPQSASCFGENDGSASSTVFGGTAPYTFAWSSGSTTSAENGLSAGTYTLTVTDAHGCTTSQTFTIAEPAQLVATVTGTDNPATCSGTGNIYVTISGPFSYPTFQWSNGANAQSLLGVGAGSYTVTVTNWNGCTATASATLTEPNAPVVTVSLPMDTLCGSFPGTVALSGESPMGGTWSGNNVSGNTFDPFNAGAGIHFITYAYTDANGCTGTATDSVYVDLCMGTATIAAANEWHLYPNPTNGVITLSFTGELNSDVLVEVYTTEGKLILTENKQQTPAITLNMTSEPVGTYFVRVTANGETTMHRIIKM